MFKEHLNDGISLDDNGIRSLLQHREHDLYRGDQIQKYLETNGIPSVFTSINPMGMWLNMIAEASMAIAWPAEFDMNLQNKVQDKQDFEFSYFARLHHNKSSLHFVQGKLNEIGI